MQADCGRIHSFTSQRSSVGHMMHVVYWLVISTVCCTTVVSAQGHKDVASVADGRGPPLVGSASWGRRLCMSDEHNIARRARVCVICKSALAR
jgi:hypothetical protein